MVNLESALQRGRRYLKGEYKSNCSNIEAEFADHCRKYALSDPKTLKYQQACNHEHKKQCIDCEDLKDTLVKIEGIHLCFIAFTDKEGEVMMYEFAESCKRILAWKAHILTVIHQDSHKHDILENLNNETAFIIMDFAMKFLSQKYRESMASWFGKSGNGMHVMCVIFKENGQLVKRTYIAFIGKTPQNFGAVIAIYESCLQQIRKDSSNIKYIIDKSDNAGCYHTEVLFAWKALWPQNITGHTFVDTMFNERQAGKDQCDRDSANELLFE